MVNHNQQSKFSKVLSKLAVGVALEQAKEKANPKPKEMGKLASFYLTSFLAFLDTAKCNLEYLLVSEDAAPYIKQRLKQRMKQVNGSIDLLSDELTHQGANMRLGDAKGFAETFLEFVHHAASDEQKCNEAISFMQAFMAGKIKVKEAKTKEG